MPTLPRYSIHVLGLASVLTLAGCAKFPENGDANNYTRIVFRLEFAGPINPNYIYDVAIHATTEENPAQPQRLAPLPVTDEPGDPNRNNPNGRMAGSPTHFVEYSASQSTGVSPFRLYQFAPGPGPNDPDNPVNLAQWFESPRRRIINFRVEERFLEFELFTDQLTPEGVDPQTLRTLLVNVLPMSRPQNIGGGIRYLDAYGNTRGATLNDYLSINLRQNRTYANTDQFEPADDTLPADRAVEPALDLVNYTIEVRQP